MKPDPQGSKLHGRVSMAKIVAGRRRSKVIEMTKRTLRESGAGWFRVFGPVRRPLCGRYESL